MERGIVTTIDFGLDTFGDVPSDEGGVRCGVWGDSA
jgi:hypothetical protein